MLVGIQSINWANQLELGRQRRGDNSTEPPSPHEILDSSYIDPPNISNSFSFDPSTMCNMTHLTEAFHLTVA